jgi:hypothetical protein
MIGPGTYAVIRTIGAGVHVGEIVDWDVSNSTVVYLKNCRRVHKWSSAASPHIHTLNEMAVRGLNKSDSRVTAPIPNYTLLTATQILPMSNLAISSFEEVGWEGDMYKLPFEAQPKAPPEGIVAHEGVTCLIRTYGAGVSLGEVDAWDPRYPGVVHLRNARQVWQWDNAVAGPDGQVYVIHSISEAAAVGPGTSGRVSEYVEEETITSALEIIPISAYALQQYAAQGWEAPYNGRLPVGEEPPQRLHADDEYA